MASGSSSAASVPPEELKEYQRLRRGETVLHCRSDRIALVVECSTEEMNESACIRSAEAMGVQTVYLVDSPLKQTGAYRGVSKRISRGGYRFVTIIRFSTIPEAIAGIRADGRAIWATDLGEGAQPLVLPTEAKFLLDLAARGKEQGREADEEYVRGLERARDGLVEVPDKVAVVMGRETDGVSPAMLVAADLRVYLPLYGFSESLNLSVATGMVLQRLFDLCPAARGDFVTKAPAPKRRALRKDWRTKLAKGEDMLRDFEAWHHHIEAGTTTAPLLPDLRRTEKQGNRTKSAVGELSDAAIGRGGAGGGGSGEQEVVGTKRPRREG